MLIQDTISPEWHRRLTISEYHRLIESGVFDEDEPLELLEGVLVTMSPQGPRHARVIQYLNQLLVRALPSGYMVRPQLPLTLGDDGEPEPDLAVVEQADAECADRHPTGALVVIEVAAESLERDRGVKAAIYARAGVREYLIVNLIEQVVEVHREPDITTGRYQSLSTHRRGSSFALTSIGTTAPEIVVDDLLGLRG